MDPVSLVRSRPRGPAGEEQPTPTQDAGDPRRVPGAPFTGKDGIHSGNHRYADQDGAGELAPPGPGPVSRRRGGRSSPAPPARRRFSRLGWLATALVLVTGGGFAGYKYLDQPHVDTPVSPPTAATGTATPNFDAALGKWQYIGTRTEDPQPLTLEQLFPLKLNSRSCARTGADSLTGNCSLAVFGANLQAALQAGHCTQMLRASYISLDGTMMGTVGVANLINSDAATKAGQVTGPTEIIAPLAGQNARRASWATAPGWCRRGSRGTT